MKQRVLIIGSGGREHAWALRLAHGAENSPRDDRTVVFCPGNGGIAKSLNVCRHRQKI